jgi:mercuric ion transport protein
MNHKQTWLGMVGAFGSAVIASLCCIGPLVLLSLGIGGAWTSSLTALAPYRPYAIVLVVMALGFAFYQLYLQPSSCEIGKPCAHPRVLFVQRVVFWVVAILILLMLTFPWYGPSLL